MFVSLVYRIRPFKQHLLIINMIPFVREKGLQNRLQLLSLLLRGLETVFVGRAQTGFQFTRKTPQKTPNKNGVALSSGFNILRRSLKSCVKAGLTFLVLSERTENDRNLGDNSLESCSLQCYQRDRKLSCI